MASNQAAQIARQIEAVLEGLMVGTVRRLTAELVQNNPVDTTHSRTNWLIGIGGRIETVEGSKKFPSDFIQQAGLAHLQAYRLGMGEINLTNSVDYMYDLMRGTSPQAARGWVESTILSVVSQMASIYGEAVNFRVSGSGASVSVP